MMLTNDGAVEPQALLCNVGGVSDHFFILKLFHFRGSTILSCLQLLFDSLVNAWTKLLIIFSLSINDLTMIALISTAASKEPNGCSHISPHWHYTKFGKENICLYIILYVIILCKDNFFSKQKQKWTAAGFFRARCVVALSTSVFR